MNYLVNEIGEFLDNYILGSSEVIIPAGESSKEIRFKVVDDYLIESDGSITISLVSNSEYLFGETSSISIDVEDTEAVPRVQVSGVRAVYDNGIATAEFHLMTMSNYEYSGTRMINISVEGAAEGIVVPTTVAMNGGFKTNEHFYGLAYAVVKIPVLEEQVISQTGQITLTVLPPTNKEDYKRVGRRSQQFNISSFDLPQSSPKPVISISSISRQVHGIEENYFKISASHPSDTPIRIYTKFLFEAAFLDPRIINNDNRGYSHFEIDLPVGVTEYEYPYKKLLKYISRHYYDHVQFSLAILDGLDYIVAASPDNIAKIDKRNQNIPAGISIYSEDSVNENWGHAKFKISASSVSQSDRIINIDVSGEDNNFLYLSGPSKITLPAGEIQTLLIIPLENDEIAESDSTITARILPGGDYTVANSNNTATIKVVDDDGIPTISLDPEILSPFSSSHPIWLDSFKWVEGDGMTVGVISSGPIADDVLINLRVSDEGGNIYNGEEYRTITFKRRNLYISKNKYAHFVYINTHDNEISGENAKIYVEVLPGTGYEVSSTNGRIGYTVYDDDFTNEVSIQALDSTITEGQYAQFQVNASIQKGKDYVVKFTFDQGNGNFIGKIEKEHFTFNHYHNFHSFEDSKGNVIIYAPIKSRIIRIPTVDDDIDEANGRLTLTLIESSNQSQYSLSTDQTKNVASVVILDNDVSPNPTISLSTSTLSVIEGATATITITSDQLAPTDGIMASYQKSQTGNFFATDFSGSDSATILAGETAKNIEFVTHDDNIEEPDGSFTITLTSSTSYTLGTTSSVTVNVTDNDDPPVISIADATAVVEGTDANAVFTLTASNPVSQLRSINVSITGATGFVQPDQIPTTATLDANSTTATLNIPIHDDSEFEADGIIIVTISTPTNADDYQIGTSNSAQVSVADDDYLVTLLAATASINEGESATFTFTLNRVAPENGLVVSYQQKLSSTFATPVSEQISNMYGSHNEVIEDQTVTIPAGETTKSISIEAIDNDIDNLNGSFNLSLSESTLYTRRNGNSIRVNVLDNDLPPTITITGGGTVVEGTDSYAEFTLSASRMVSLGADSSLPIRVLTIGPTGVIEYGKTIATAQLSPYQSTATLRVMIPDNNFVEPDGHITARILASEHTGWKKTYIVGTPNTAQVQVENDDENDY